MIPTREQIEADWANPRFTPETTALIWLRAMRDEIDHLTFMGGLATKALTDAGWTLTGVEWKPPIGPNPSPLLEQIERLKAELGEANSARNSWKVGSEVLIADRDRCRTDLKAANETIAVLRKVADLSESVSGQLQADLDRANTEAALARDALAKATTDTRAKVQNELRSVERALCSADVLIKYAAWSRGAYECHVKNTIETAIEALRDDSATTPYSPPFEGDPKNCAFKASDPVREEEIKAWRDWALGDIADPDLYDDCFVLSRAEIDAAVALMRRAGDGKALLRELRAWIIDEKWFVPGIVRKIDEMLARPCPEVPETPKIQPSEDREAKIEAWEKEALTVESGEEPFGQGYFLLRRSEITAAVALMRSADGKALLRELRAKATTPAPEREAAIRMLERRALQYLDHSEKSRFSSDGEGYRDEITAAVAMIRSATDGKALLRELRAWVSEQNYNGGFGTVIQASRILAAIDRLLSLDLDRVDPKPAPVEQPAAAVPDDIGLGPVTDEMVQSGIAAVKDGRWITLEQLRKELAPAPDDTRELVAQLADVAAEFFVAPWGDRARAIAAKLRGGA